jgi:hypothetical protein
MRFAGLCRNTRIRALLFFPVVSLPRSTQNSLPREIRFGTLLLPALDDGNLIGLAPGAGTGEPPSSYGALDRSINSGVPFGKGTGVFWRAGSGFGMAQAGRGGRQSSRGFLGTGTASTRDRQVADFGRGFAAHRKRDFSSVGMRSPPSLASQVRRLDRDADLVETAENR